MKFFSPVSASGTAMAVRLQASVRSRSTVSTVLASSQKIATVLK